MGNKSILTAQKQVEMVAINTAAALHQQLESANAELERYKTFAEHEFKIKDKLYAENARLSDEIEQLKGQVRLLDYAHGKELTDKICYQESFEHFKEENARLRAALEVYREFKIGIPHHNGAIIYLAEETLEKLK